MRDTTETREPTAEEKLAAFQTALETKVELLKVQVGDIVLVKPAGEAHRPWTNMALDELSKALGQRYGQNAGLLLVLPPGADIEGCNEDMMREHGWVRAPKD